MERINITLFNSLTKQKELFKPLNPPFVYMYVCGPTVYDYVHIGNMRPVVVFDTLRRLLLSLGYEVIFVSNYTDVDDKIIKKAQETKETESDISNFFIKAYEQNVAAVGALNASFNPRATDHINGIIAFIETLIVKKAAYVVGGDVYFRVSSAKDYGVLANIKTDELVAGARIEENKEKENAADFILWKETKIGLNWPSPWGNGRPGWHTECVVMINDVFKRPLIDIHGGGFDLKFPHHENEIAQAQIYSGTHLANYWLHNGFINLGNEKMAKSTGNYITAHDFLKKHSGLSLRLLLLSSHYRAPVNISDDIIENINKELEKIERSAKSLHLYLALNNIKTKENDELIVPFYQALADDLNTPNALSEVYEIMKKTNTLVRQKASENSLLPTLAFTLFKMLDVLGIALKLPEINDAERQLFQEYNTARKEQNYAKSDELRAILQLKGLI